MPWVIPELLCSTKEVSDLLQEVDCKLPSSLDEFDLKQDVSTILT